MNHVWRVQGKPSVVVKYAPPWVASQPEIALSQDRALFEARALAAVAACAHAHVRAPRLLHADGPLLVMEDLGDLPDLRRWLRSVQDGRDLGRRLGEFLSRVHGLEVDPTRFDNADVQRTRETVQYRQVPEFCARLGLPRDLGQPAVELGRRLVQDPGAALIMGDFWPASILVAEPEVRVIDWEFVHHGNPAQDLGHLLAHLWMIGLQEAPSARSCWDGFREGYSHHWHDGVWRDAAIHFASELAARMVGPFSTGSPFHEVGPQERQFGIAVHAVADSLGQFAFRWPG